VNVPHGLRRLARRRVLVVAATLAVVVALGVTLADGWSTVQSHDWELAPGWLAGAAVLLAVGYTLAAVAYARVTALLSPAAADVQPALRRGWAVSILGRYVPGNVLMVAGRMEMARDAGVPRRAALAASTYEQILMLVASACGAVGFVALRGDLGRGEGLWLVTAVPFLVVVLHPAVMRRVSDRVLKRIGREPLATVLSTSRATRLFGLYVVIQGAVGLATWMIVRGTAGPAGDALFGTLAYQLAFTLSMLAFIFPAGLGIRDGALALALSQELPAEVALAAAVLVRLAMTLFELGFVVLVVAVTRWRS